MRCCRIPHRPKHSTQRTAGISTATSPADRVSTAALRHKGAPRPVGGSRGECRNEGSYRGVMVMEEKGC
jgi:hypothetical protein